MSGSPALRTHVLVLAFAVDSDLVCTRQLLTDGESSLLWLLTSVSESDDLTGTWKIVFVTALRGDVSADVRHKCVCLALFLFVCVHLHGFATGIDCWCWRHAACIPPGTDSGVKRELSRIFSLSLCGAVLARKERSSVISVRRNWAKEVALADVRLARFAHTCARPGICGGQ